MSFFWSIGITTVPERRDTLLPQTLASLTCNGGFESIRVFVDLAPCKNGYYPQPSTIRHPRIGAFGNWLMGLQELWIRSSQPRPCPKCDGGILIADRCNGKERRIGHCEHHEPTRFIMFQDDLVCVRNLRQYLEAVQWPDKGYLNLYTFMRNEQIIAGQPTGWHESIEILGGNYPHLQAGYGALALAFTREAVRDLLSKTPIMLDHAAHPTYSRYRIDPTVCEAMNKAGYRQYVHNPSLVRHTGLLSTLQTELRGQPTNCPFAPDQSFPGENFDALGLLPTVQSR